MDMFMLSGNIPSGALISLGTLYGEKYYVSDDCLSCLTDISLKLAHEDKGTRSFRRSLAFMDIIKKDLVPILLYVKDKPEIYRATVKLLGDLTVPMESLVPVEALNKTPQGMHVVFDLNNLLYGAKEAFVRNEATKALVEYLGSYCYDVKSLTTDEREAVNETLVLIRNILTIPERPVFTTAGFPTPTSTSYGSGKTEGSSGGSSFGDSSGGSFEPKVGFSASNCQSFLPINQQSATSCTSQQNQLLWNLFANDLDKVLLQLMNCSQKEWSVTMVQLVALLYKDQHVENLQKLLSAWATDDTSSGSSDDDESNTSPPHEGQQSVDFFSTSSANSGSNNNEMQDGENSRESRIGEDFSPKNSPKESFPSPFSQTSLKSPSPKCADHESEMESLPKGSISSKLAHIGIESPATTESGFDISRSRRLKRLSSTQLKKIPRTSDEICRRKLLKRRKTTRIRMKARLLHKPNEEEISNLLKEFTIDFLLKGYGNLVGDLHDQIIGQMCVTLDKSHMLWLITYFLRFATQLKLELTRVWPVLSPEMLAYLIAESVNLNEELELAVHSPKRNIKPYLRRLHLSVTALREFLQAMNTYWKIPLQSVDDRTKMDELKGLLPELTDLRNLLLLLIRHYNPVVQSKRYLRDVILTNQILLKSLDRCTSIPGYSGKFKLASHLNLFCTPLVLRQYGLCLEEYATNESRVNDSVLTLFHHVAGDLGCPELLFDPIILKTFVRLFEDDFELAEEWTDLVEYVTRTFLRCVNAGSLKSSPAHSCRNRSNNGSGSQQSDRSNASCSSAKRTQVTSGQKQLEEEVGSNSSHMSPNEEEALPEILSRLNDAGMGEEISWLQKSLLVNCAVKLAKGTQPGKTMYTDPIALVANETRNPMPIVPFTEEQEAALRCLPFLRLVRCLGLDPPLVPTRILPRIPHAWDADTSYSVALQLGAIRREDLKFDLSQVQKVALPPPSVTEIVPPSHSYGCPTGVAANLSCVPDQWIHWLDQSSSMSQVRSKSSSGNQQDTASNTSSLQVHKTDTSDSEMEGSPERISPEPMDMGAG